MRPADGASNVANRRCAQSAPLTLILSPRSEGRGQGEGWLGFTKIARTYRKTVP